MQTLAVITFDGSKITMFGKINTMHSIPPLVDAIRYDRTGNVKFPKEVALVDVDNLNVYHVKGTRNILLSDMFSIKYLIKDDAKVMLFENYEFS